jgi:hypothetical protein
MVICQVIFWLGYVPMVSVCGKKKKKVDAAGVRSV